MPNCLCMPFLKLRTGVLSKTLSHMWGKLNLPMFIFNVGLLNIILNIKESIFIRVNNPTLNRNIGKFNLPTYGIGSYLTPLVLMPIPILPIQSTQCSPPK